MADISKILLPNGITYDIKDAYSRGLVVNVTLGSGTTCSSDTTVTDIINAVNNGRNVICIVDSTEIYPLVFCDLDGEVRFRELNIGDTVLIIGSRTGNTESWTYGTDHESTGTVVNYIEWSYQ